MTLKEKTTDCNSTLTSWNSRVKAVQTVINYLERIVPLSKAYGYLPCIRVGTQICCYFQATPNAPSVETMESLHHCINQKHSTNLTDICQS